MGRRWEEKFPSRRRGMGTPGNGSGKRGLGSRSDGAATRGDGLAPRCVEQSVSRPGPQRRQTRRLDRGGGRARPAGFSSYSPSLLTSESRVLHHVRANKSSSNSGPICRRIVHIVHRCLFIRHRFSSTTGKRFMLLRNPGAFIGQAVSPLQSCYVSRPRQALQLIVTVRDETFGFHLYYLIWFRNGIQCALSIVYRPRSNPIY